MTHELLHRLGWILFLFPACLSMSTWIWVYLFPPQKNLICVVLKHSHKEKLWYPQHTQLCSSFQSPNWACSSFPVHSILQDLCLPIFFRCLSHLTFAVALLRITPSLHTVNKDVYLFSYFALGNRFLAVPGLHTSSDTPSDTHTL